MDMKKVKFYAYRISLLIMAAVVVVGWSINRKNQMKERAEAIESSTEEKETGMILHTDPELTIEKGSMINFSFHGEINGEDVGSSDHMDLTVGGGKLSPELEESLLGHHPGDEYDIQVKTSNRLSVKKSIRGKMADVHVVIHGIYTYEYDEDE
ncbi:MAG: hypothetical protein Q4E53_09835 [Eubacteriales bacterium]|nr:hypothetical protein [Eubacteriales bacterium]